MTEATPKKKRFLLKALVAIVLVVVLLVALAPTILSMGIARGIARDAIASAVNGDVKLGSVSLGWFSDQSVEALSVRTADGTNSADVSVTLKGGLLSLITSGGGTLDVALKGSIVGTREKDGTFGFASLVKPSSGGASGGSSSGGSGAGGSSPIVANVTIESLAIEVKDLASGKRYALDGLKGTATYDGGKGSASAQLASATDFGGAKGSVEIKASASNLGTPIDLAKLAADCSLTATNIRVPAGDRDADFRSITLTVASPGLSQTVSLAAKAEGVIDGTASTLNADLVVNSLVNSAGAVAFKPANVQGTIEAANLPTSLLQPSLAATNVRLTDDLGPIIERLSVQIPGASKPVTVALQAEKATLTASAEVNAETGAVSQGSLAGELLASPESLKRLASTDVAGPVRLALRGSGLSWSPSETGAPLERLVGRLELQPKGPITWLENTRKIAVSLGDSTVLAFGRDAATDPFALAVRAAVGLGGSAAPPSAPTAPNVLVNASIDPALSGVRDTTVQADVTADPAFLLATSGRSFTKPVRVIANVRNLVASLPADGIGGIAVDADVKLAGETGLYVEQVNRDIPLRDILVTVKSEELTKEIQLAVDGVVDTATIEIRETVRSLPKDLSTLDAFAVNARGTTRITGLSGAALVAWVPQQRAILEAARIDGLSIDLANEPLPGKPGQRVTLALGGKPIAGNVIAGLEKDRASIDRLDLAGTIGRELVAALQSSSATPVKLAADAPFTLALAQPTSFTFDELSRGALPAGLAAHLTLEQVAIAEAPGLKGALALQSIDTTVEVDQTATKAKAKGSFNAKGSGAATDRIEGATFDLAWDKPADAAAASLLQGLSGTVRLAGVNVPWIEALGGMSKGTISNWTGDDGSMTLSMGRTAEGESIRLVPEFPRIASGTVDVLASGERLTATAKGVAVRVPPATLESIAVKPGQPNDAPRYGFQSDLAITLNDATVQLPKGLAKGGDPIAGASVNLAMAIEPLAVRVLRPGAPTETLNVPAIDATVSSQDILKGITISATDRGAVAGGPSFRVTGGVRDLADAKGAFSSEAAILDLDADIQQIPTVLLDLLAATNGSLTRSLGDRVSLKANAKGLSAKSGQASATVTAPYVDLAIPDLSISKDGVARITEKNPLTASFALSPGIKDDILYVINTIFADIELVKERGTLTVRDLSYPLSGNLAELDGNLTLDIGDIRMRNGRPVSVLFELLEKKPVAGSEGRIEPLVVKIEKGRLTYQDFGLRLFKVEGANGAPPTWRNVIAMKGDVDLAKKVVNGITTSIPASQIANYSGDATKFFAKIGGADSEIAKKLAVDVKLYGPLYDEKGNFRELQKTIGFPAIEDALNDPGALLKDGLKLVPGLIDKGKESSGSSPAAPAAPAKDAPKAPAKDTPKAPAKDAPKEPAKDTPKAPAKDAPKAPAKDTPKAPAKDAPKEPAKDTPKAPAKDAPKAPAKDAPKAPAKDAPKAPAKEKPATPPADKPTAPPTAPPTTPPTTPPTAPPATPPTAPPKDKPATPPTDPPAEKPVTPPADPPKDKPTSPPTEPPKS